MSSITTSSGPRWELTVEAEKVIRAKYDGRRSTAEAIASEIGSPTYKVMEWAEKLGVGPLAPAPLTTQMIEKARSKYGIAERACVVCGTMYAPSYKAQRACSRECSHALIKETQKANAGQKAEMVKTARAVTEIPRSVTPAPSLVTPPPPEADDTPVPIAYAQPNGGQPILAPDFHDAVRGRVRAVAEQEISTVVARTVSQDDPYDELTVRVDANLALLMRLLLLLPTKERAWRSSQRRRWLEAFRSSLDLVIEELED